MSSLWDMRGSQTNPRPTGSRNGLPQRLRQMRPIKNLDELADAAFQAGHLILSGAITRQVASDDLWGIAMASGFVDRYGEDAVQAHIAVSLPPNDETGEMTITCEDPHVVNAQQRTIEDELDARAPTQTSTLPQVRAITLDKFLEMDIPPRSTMLTPWLQNQGLAMIYAPRGTGKTRVAHGVCHAIATGSGFLRWIQRRNLSEFSCLMVRCRRRSCRRCFAQPCKQAKARWPIRPTSTSRPRTYFEMDFPTSPVAGQAFYRDVIADADFVVIDNLSTICRSLKENGPWRFVALASPLFSFTTPARPARSAEPPARKTYSTP